ncbi:MAG: sodium-translocating pyrophosphatase [Planctomycetaceae bacterium]|nr:sodium-translocating pyrophosphatase [Planctomycetaceae bacterium]
MARVRRFGKAGSKTGSHWKNRLYIAWLAVACVGFVAAAGWVIAAEPTPPTSGAPTAATADGHFRFFEPFVNPQKYPLAEQAALVVVLLIAVAGLVYARMLVKQVREAGQGTPRMQEIAGAVREGANAYLSAQAKKIVPLIVIITVALFFTKYNPWNPIKEDLPFAWGRAVAFLLGSLFSLAVGWNGMKLATTGNLRVAAAARRSYGEAMQLGYRTGTITGMLTDGLGLLGGTAIFMIYGEQAYEALLGFGFGGTLLALFMRVGGGIYTKAADVGADLVGKVEAGIPEDDPRNAATIADNVGDNVGDCAGMAADIFESYEVTIVAAMILGLASFGHKGVIFPLLVRGIGVLGSIISTYTVKAGPNDTSDTALKSVHRGFWIGSLISIVGFFAIGAFYLHFSADYFKDYGMAVWGFPALNGTHSPANLAAWFNWGMPTLDMRPAFTCLIGVFLAVALNKVTSYYTHTSHSPVKSLARACQTGHATNIIQGFAVGYESTVAALLVIVVAIMLSVLCYWGMPAVFVAYGIAMTGIGMLTLTGNTISMDVFGPVADNANGIGEMGYNRGLNGQELKQGDKDFMPPAENKRARQILADLDAVGNTTKAETKGIAIGSAVIAAFSLFASFIAVIAVGSEDRLKDMTTAQYNYFAGFLTMADPKVLIGLMIGGAVPFLFSSMLIRAVGRAAFFIVKECRIQFKDPAIMAGTKKPNYGRVVNICTNTAQKELIGPALLAISAPFFVGFLLGPYALGGFLAGMILVGQLLAVFMANAGGAWDNAKKLIEDEPRTESTGKGSEKHKAAVTGDTVGDPLKDTAGPAINPMVKVMNMVSLLGLGLVLAYNVSGVHPKVSEFKPEMPVTTTLSNLPTNWHIGLIVAVACVLVTLWAVWRSKHESSEMKEIVGGLDE